MRFGRLFPDRLPQKNKPPKISAVKLESLNPLVLILSLLFMASLDAGTRTSADYSMSVDTVDSAGCRTSSAHYTNDGSAGLIAGISTAQTQTVVKSGYVAQLTDVKGLVLSAPQSAVVEGTTIQLSAFEILDDDTLALLAPQKVAWGVQSGPLTGVSTGGIATASQVNQHTLAVIAASHLGFQETLGLTVLQTGADEFGSYAADGLPDDWQVRWFGTDNPLAAPHADASSTGQDNLFKWIAGLNPVDGSRFLAAASPVPDQPGKMWFSFSPIVAGNTYVVEYNDTLLPDGWHALTGYSQDDNGATRTITDNTAPGDHRFYRVVIGMP